MHETGRRHRDGHRLIDRQQHPGSSGEPARGQVGHFARRKIRRARLSLSGARSAYPQRGRRDRPSRHALSRRRRGLEPRCHGAGDPRCRARGARNFPRDDRHHHGLGRAVDARHRRGGRHRPQQEPQACGTLRRAQSDVVHRLGDARHLVQDQRRQLFDLVGLRHLEPLYRQCLRDHPDRQAGHYLRGRLRRARLVVVGSVRRDGCDVFEIQRHAGHRFACLRYQPRRFCHRRRRGRACSGGT